MTEIYRPRLSTRFGFYPTAALTGEDRIQESIIDGRNVWCLGDGLKKTAAGLALAAMNLGGPRLYLVGSSVGELDSGSVVPFRNGGYWFIGSGAVNIDGVLIGNAASSLQFNPGLVLANAKPAGLHQPGAPLAIASDPVALPGIMSGTYSCVVTRVRSSTGGESIASLPSNILALKNQQFGIQFGSVENSSQDMWGVYFTFKGRGSVGPSFLYGDIAESSIPGNRIVNFNFYDSQLLAIQPPTTYNPPPQGQFVATLGNLMIVLGSFGANNIFAGISPSAPGVVDGYPAGLTAFLNPLESIIGFAARPSEGELVLWTNNSLQALILTGSPSFPVLPRAVWSTTGIQSPHGGCFADSIFYGYAGTAGPVRMGGEDPDTSFAQPIYEFLRNENWDPKTVVVGYDRVRDAVVYCGSGTSGNLAVPFMRSANPPQWSTPFTLPGVPQSAVTVNGQLKICIANLIYDWEKGAGGPAYEIPAWQDGPDPADRKTVTGYRTTFDTGTSPYQVDLLLDLNTTPVAGATQITTPAAPGPHQTPWKPLNTVPCRQYTLKISSNGAGHKYYDKEMEIFHDSGIKE